VSLPFYPGPACHRLWPLRLLRHLNSVACTEKVGVTASNSAPPSMALPHWPPPLPTLRRHQWPWKTAAYPPFIRDAPRIHVLNQTPPAPMANMIVWWPFRKSDVGAVRNRQVVLHRRQRPHIYTCTGVQICRKPPNRWENYNIQIYIYHPPPSNSWWIHNTEFGEKETILRSSLCLCKEIR
jgi:hypothetical protein